jgi:drug/metabolite transporter (DMT)-like permease
VSVADASLATSVAPRLSGALTAVLGAGAAVGALAMWASRRSGWARCATSAAAGATAFGLVSALVRLVSLHLTSGVNDLDDVGVWLPPLGITAALAGGGWAVQQAHAARSPAVIVGCLTVIDPVVAVGLGMAMLGERTRVSRLPRRCVGPLPGVQA